MERTNYMQNLMTSTYPNISIEAVLRGFDGSWERLIAKQLNKDSLANHSEACEILDACDQDPLKAAYLITSSKISDNVNA